MGQEEYKRLKGGIVKRKNKKILGLFIDGSGLDRATRRLEKKVDLSSLVSGLTTGMQLEVARYYTLIPNEDDARQFSFLDAVERAGLQVEVKRLPPKGVKRQVSMDVHIATDLLSFGYGNFAKDTPENSSDIKRVAIVVCPTRELSYAMFTCSEHGTETSLADFGNYGNTGGWKGVTRWIDLSTSETIWR